MSQRPVIHWFRRDLRMRDNIAFHSACGGDAPVIPLFIIDTNLLDNARIGAPRLKFLLNALRALDERLQQYGTRLLVKHGDPREVLPQLIQTTNTQALHFNQDYSPYATKRDEAIVAQVDIPVHQCNDVLLLEPGTVLKNDGDPYTVYTYFWKKWKKHPKPEESVRHFRDEWFYDLSELQNDGIPAMTDLGFEDVDVLAEANEDAALDRLKAFTDDSIKRYSELRDTLPINPFAADPPEGTSYLSPYLRLGLLSPRQAYWAARDAYDNTRSKAYQEAIEIWVKELAWREFYTHILHFFPHVMQRDFVDTYAALEWRDAPDELLAWKDGMTGYPIVDAPMRQLRALGWMPNRARMIVASFLTKDLLIHWKHGDIHFMQHLIDGDPASNNGGWQWAAGTGTDAQPYFRIFNPISQSKRYANPEYLRHWLPELCDVADEHIHEPWEMDEPPADYPARIVDHSAARERTLAAFKAARGEN